jgi:P pilus assembly chaperone PapD
MIIRRALCFGVAALAGALCCAGPTAGLAEGGADLNLSPKRVVFDPQTRSAVVYVFNRGTTASSYNIELSDKVMTPDGQIRDADAVAKLPEGSAAAAQLKSAKSMIVFTPRHVTLEGGSSQVIRLRVLRPADLAAGEYRSHLTVTQVPPNDTGLTAEQAAGTDEKQLSVHLTAQFAISIPLIVRQGPADIRAAIDDVKYAVRAAPRSEPGSAASQGVISMQLARQGPSSLFGDLEVYTLVKGKQGETIGALRGVGVYPEVDHRAVELALSRKAASGEQLMVIFRSQDAKPGDFLAKTEYTVP